MNRQRMLTQRHLLECYLFLRDFWIEVSSTDRHMQLRKKSDARTFYLQVDPEWLRLKSTATVEHRLDALGLVPFLEQNGSAWIRLTATGKEVVTHLVRDVEP